MADRFFAVLVGEYVHVWGIPTWGPWDRSRLHFWDEPSLDLSLQVSTADCKIWTRADLDAAMREFREASPPRTLWIHESLADDVRRLWEEPRAFRKEFARNFPPRSTP
jgi:hypothetical protein